MESNNRTDNATSTSESVIEVDFVFDDNGNIRIVEISGVHYFIFITTPGNVKMLRDLI